LSSFSLHVKLSNQMSSFALLAWLFFQSSLQSTIIFTWNACMFSLFNFFLTCEVKSVCTCTFVFGCEIQSWRLYTQSFISWIVRNNALRYKCKVKRILLGLYYYKKREIFQDHLEIDYNEDEDLSSNHS
jgi:hypothetical protein